MAWLDEAKADAAKEMERRREIHRTGVSCGSPLCCMVNRGYFAYGADRLARAWVVNFTGKWFSVGVTTSPATNGHFCGLTITDKNAKRGGRSGFTEYRGWLCQVAFWWFKVYLYLYFDGDGRLKKEVEREWPTDEYSLAC